MGNNQGSVHFLNLTTGKEVVRRQFTVLPITREVIARVNELGKSDDVPTYLSFADIEDDPEPEHEYKPDPDDHDSYYDPNDYTTDDLQSTMQSEWIGKFNPTNLQSLRT